MGSYLFFSSLREFLRFRRIVPWILLGLAGLALAVTWHYLNPNATQVDQYTNVSAILVFHVLALASAIFSTAIISQEVEQKTIVYLLTRPISRWKLLVARYVASAIVVSLIGIFGALAVSAGVYHGGLFSNGLLKRDIIAILFGAFSYGALFLLVSLIINRAMIVCLLFAFGWETVVPNMPGEMYRLSVYSHVMAIADHPSNATQSTGLGLMNGSLGTNALTSSTAMATLVVLSIILVAISCLWFTHFEYVPREDAE